jgi:hypothetical protein
MPDAMTLPMIVALGTQRSNTIDAADDVRSCLYAGDSADPRQERAAPDPRTDSLCLGWRPFDEPIMNYMSTTPYRSMAVPILCSCANFNFVNLLSGYRFGCITLVDVLQIRLLAMIAHGLFCRLVQRCETLPFLGTGRVLRQSWRR